MNKIEIKIMRHEMGAKKGYWQSFWYEGRIDVPVTYVLDQLNSQMPLYDIQGKESKAIVWECSCLQSICGACAMVINGKPQLACHALVVDLIKKKNVIELRPLSKFPIICDLKVDRSILQETVKKMELMLKDEAIYSPKHINDVYAINRCIMCGCCLEICPNYKKGSDFMGAIGTNTSYKLLMQTQQKEDIKKVKSNYNKKIFSGCSNSLMCEEICPMKIPTSINMSKMNRLSVWGAWKLMNKISSKK